MTGSVQGNKKADVTEISYIRSICVITVALIQFETSSEFEPTSFRWVHLYL